MTFDDGIDGSLCGGIVSHIERRCFCLQPAPLQSTRDHFERINSASIKCDDCANFCETFGHSQTKAARSAGNKCNPSFE